MSKHLIEQLIKTRVVEPGLVESGIKGVQLFRMTEPLRCAPVIYEPCIIAIVSGAKVAILDGERYVYDASRYLCCPVSMPVEAGTAEASPETPLLGVYITIDTQIMSDIVVQMERAKAFGVATDASAVQQSLSLATWDTDFTDALLRLVQLSLKPADTPHLAQGRLRELYYAILKGEAGQSARRAFGVGDEITRAIDYLCSRLDEPTRIDDLAEQAGMSRAVLHRKFKQATRLSPIQFVKSMRLNQAAMKIAGGMAVSTAALEVGYVSASQFSREFKRMYGQSPRQWREETARPIDFAQTA